MKQRELEGASGKFVYTTHAGAKMVDRAAEHGPYKLLKITGGGNVMLEGYDFSDVAPRHITRFAAVEEPKQELDGDTYSSSYGYGGWGHDE